MFERFSNRSRRVLQLSQEEARLLDHGFIGTEHILLSLVREGEGVGAQALARVGVVSLDTVRDEVQKTVGPSRRVPSNPLPFTPRAKKVLELSFREATQLGHRYIGTEHLLLGVIREGEGTAVRVIKSLGADLGQLRREVVALLPGSTEGVGSTHVGTGIGAERYQGSVAVLTPDRAKFRVPHPMRWWRVRMWRSAIAKRGCRHEWTPWQVIEQPKPHRLKKCSKCRATRVSKGHRRGVTPTRRLMAQVPPEARWRPGSRGGGG